MNYQNDAYLLDLWIRKSHVHHVQRKNHLVWCSHQWQYTIIYDYDTQFAMSAIRKNLEQESLLIINLLNLNCIRMYLISQIYKPGRTGWKYLCKVFAVVGNEVRNCTASMSDRLWLTYNKWNIVILSWCWTWVMVITAELEKYTWAIPNKDIFDVSVFK